MKKHKMRRSDKPDRRLDRPFPGGRKLRIVDHSDSGGFVGYYELGRFRELVDDGTVISERHIYCWLFHGREQVGGFSMVEFEGMLFDNEFEQILDMNSWEEATFSFIVCRAWPNMADNILPYGSIIYFKRLWVKPAFARVSEWADIANTILKRIERRRALLLLKAFPLEYEGNGRRNMDIASAHRQDALIRLYKRRLDMKPLPGSAGEDGWMYSVAHRLIGVLEEPIPFDYDDAPTIQRRR